MKYENANNLLPPDLIDAIQRYWQGGYLYIPKKAEDTSEASPETEYKIELSKRNGHIYTKYLEGWSVKKLAVYYSLSESSIRRILSNQRKEANTMHTKIYEALKNWDLEHKSLLQQHTSVWEVDGRYMLKIYSDIPSLKRNADILTLLRQAGIPAAKVIPTKYGQPFAQCGDHAYLLTGKLEGKHYSSPISSRFAKQVGTILARLHIAFRDCESYIQPWNNSLLDEMTGWIHTCLKENQWQLIPFPVYRDVLERLSALYPRLPIQMIHRDVHLGNFLFSGEQFSGYIDFDLSQRNIRIFDLCYFLVGLLASESAADLADPWDQIVSAAVEGYTTLLPLSSEEKAAIPVVMESIEILFTAYFLSIQDIACASDAVNILHRIRSEKFILK